MGKRERKGWKRLLYPLTHKRAVAALRLGISRENPGNTGKSENYG
jgi:hypothetical protein